MAGLDPATPSGSCGTIDGPPDATALVGVAGSSPAMTTR
jgi:hypothetical protein